MGSGCILESCIQHQMCLQSRLHLSAFVRGVHQGVTLLSRFTNSYICLLHWVDAGSFAGYNTTHWLAEASPNMRSTDIIYCHILSLSILVLKLIKCCKSFQIAHTNLTNSIVHWYWALWNANCNITTEHHSGVILECCEFNFFIFSTCIVKPVHKWIISTKCKQIKVDIDIFIRHNQNLWFDSLDPFLWGCNFGLQIF